MAAVVTGATADDRTTAWGQYESVSNATRADEYRAQADLLRDLIECPAAVLRGAVAAPVRSAPVPVSADIVRITEGIVRERAFDRLPILGDALEEAGCGDQALLEHCHGPGPHVLGCWALERVRAAGITALRAPSGPSGTAGGPAVPADR
jgi:hypothetical protein